MGFANCPPPNYAFLIIFSVMGDFWWGIVEKNGPQQYDWAGYGQLLSMLGEIGLKIEATMSFRMQCRLATSLP